MTGMAISEESTMADISAVIDSAIDEVAPAEDATAENDGETETRPPEGEAPKADPDEEKARARGWMPKEAFKGDPNEWVDAGEFNRRQPLFEKLGTQGKRIKDLEKKLESVAKFQVGLVERTRTETIAEIEAKKREAVRHGDVEAYEAADAELKKVEAEELPKFEEESEEEEPEQRAPEIPPFVTKFAQDNPWFESDPDMTAVMVNKTQMLVAGGVPLEQAIVQAKEHVKTVFPAKFANPNKDKPAAVMSGSREQRQSNAPKRTMASLSPEERDVWRALKGHVSEKEFLKSLE